MGGRCNQCGAQTNTVCSDCNVIYYCSTECQLKDWETHALQCSDKTMSVDLSRDIKRSAVEYIKQERKFTALLRWIDTAKLEDALAKMEIVTVFAPTAISNSDNSCAL